LGLVTNLVSFAFVNESMYGKFMRFIRAPTYEEYFGHQIRNVRGDRFGTVAPSNTYIYCFTLLVQSPDGATSCTCGLQTDNNSTVIAVTS